MKYCRIKDVPINVGHYYIKCHPRSKIIFEEGDNIIQLYSRQVSSIRAIWLLSWFEVMFQDKSMLFSASLMLKVNLKFDRAISNNFMIWLTFRVNYANDGQN